MGIIKAFLIFIEVLSSLLLIGVILLQKAKDEGLGLAFGAGVGESLFGSRAGNVLTKITIGLAIVFLANTLLIGVLVAGHGSGEMRSITDRLPSGVPSAPMAPAALPGGDGGAAPAPVPGGNASVDSTPVSVPVPAPAAVPAPAPAAPAPAAP